MDNKARVGFDRICRRLEEALGPIKKVNRDGHFVTQEIALKALAAKQSKLISGDTPLRILTG